MPVTRIEELPEYQKEYTDYTIALRDAGEDETAQLKAKLGWSTTENALREKMHSQNESERQMNDAKAKVAADFPDVPASIYETAATPEEVQTRAQAFNDALVAKVGQQPAGEGETGSGGGAAGGQPPIGAGQPPAGSGDGDYERDYRAAVDGIKGNADNAAKRKPHIDKVMNMGLHQMAKAMKYTKDEARQKAGSR